MSYVETLNDKFVEANLEQLEDEQYEQEQIKERANEIYGVDVAAEIKRETV